MSDKEIIQMIIDKLDRLEDKVDDVKDKLSEFEVSAQVILSSHEIEIKNHEKELETLKKKVEFVETKSTEKVQNSQNILKTILDSSYFNYCFRFIVLFLLSIIAGSDKIKLISGILK